MAEPATIAARVGWVRERMQAARDRSTAGNRSRPLVLVAATKGASRDRVQEAIEAGIDAVGENRLQELTAKFAGRPPAVPCHFIGRLQRNKVRLALQWCGMIQSVDSLALAETIHARHLESGAGSGSSARGGGRPILVQVNVAGEATKGGIAPEALDEAVERMAQWPGLAVEGLMTIPPYAPDPEAARPHFRRLRLLAERIDARRVPGVSMATLSMGMSHDFDVAIEEGATMVRIGTALFGARQ